MDSEESSSESQSTDSSFKSQSTKSLTQSESTKSSPEAQSTESLTQAQSTINEKSLQIIKKLSDGLDQYYTRFNENPPDYTFKEWCDKNGYDDDDLEEELGDLEEFVEEIILSFDGNFPVKKKPFDEDDLNKSIIAVIRGILDETQNICIPQTDQSHCDKVTTDPINECISIKRLLSLLKMYSHLDIMNNKKHQNLLIEQMNENEEYKEFLNDYIHLLSDHSHQIQIINLSLEPCKISECKYTSRHHRREDIEEMKQIDDNDKNLNFYVSTMDSLHFYLHHLFDVGLRIKSSTNENEDKSQDAQFSRVYEAVNKGKEVSKSFDRFQNNTKFTIITETGIKID